MLDNLYEDIGGKIKNLAKWIFILEAIGAIITGFDFFSKAEYNKIFILYGFLIMILGPIVAWVGSWLLYAFGELVENVCAIRSKEYRATVNTTAVSSTTTTYTTKPSVVAAPSISNGWRCTCGRNHAAYESSCVCGVTKAEARSTNSATTENDPNKANAPISAEIKDGEKVCPKCGTAQKADRRVCWSCGQPFAN